MRRIHKEKSEPIWGHILQSAIGRLREFAYVSVVPHDHVEVLQCHFLVGFCHWFVPIGMANQGSTVKLPIRKDFRPRNRIQTIDHEVLLWSV